MALGLGAVDDLDLWAYARDHSYAVVTKDSDFQDISAVRGAPPKVVWQRVGNRTVNELEGILRPPHRANGCHGHSGADPSR